MPSTRFTNVKLLLPALESALSSFLESKANFRVVRTVKAQSRQAPTTTALPSRQGPVISSPAPNQAKTLYILDSSYNPPSRAHLAFAKTVLQHVAQEQKTKSRLLLLFSTHNADKKDVDPRQFVHRIAMMVLLAGDLLGELTGGKGRGILNRDQEGDARDVRGEGAEFMAAGGFEIDIGLTKSPYYTDKSLGIASATDEETKQLYYPGMPTHVHLLGYDTVTRFLAAKYYPSYDPPLSAVAPYFDARHELRVLLRPEGEDAGSEREQRVWVEGLKNGSLEKEGFKREWGERISVVKGMGSQAKGVSSTKIREAVEVGDWDVVSCLCSDGVAEYVREMRLYVG